MGKKFMAITVATVLKIGEWRNRGIHVEYAPKHVEWIKKQIEQHVSCDFNFICLTDVDLPYGVSLQYNLPGWWSKLELFRKDLELTDVFYLDLDTVIVDDISHIVSFETGEDFFMSLQNLTNPSRGIGSGLLRWKGDYSHLFEKFIADHERIQETYVTSNRWGDQGFIQDNLFDIQKFQDVFPNEIVSYKTNLKFRDPNEQNKIIVFHGEPKPWNVNKPWIPKL